VNNVNVTTTRFGELTVEESKIMVMPEGMLGFEETRFILLTPQSLAPFCWFQAVDNPELAFVVVDTQSCITDYSVKLTAEEYEKLGLSDSAEVVFLAVVTMAADPFEITVNLQGPIAINPERMLAKQIVLEGGKYTTRHLFFDPAMKGAVTAQQKAPRDRAVESLSASNS
jgi:flagellar assembly factor FliW